MLSAVTLRSFTFSTKAKEDVLVAFAVVSTFSVFEVFVVVGNAAFVSLTAILFVPQEASTNAERTIIPSRIFFITLFSFDTF